MKPIPVPGGVTFKIFIFLLALIVVVIHPFRVDAHESDEILRYHSFLSEAEDPLAEVVLLVRDLLTTSGSSFSLQTNLTPSIPILIACEKLVNDKQVNNESTILVVVDLNHAQDVAWSLSVWLSMLEEYTHEGVCGSVAFSILPRLDWEPFHILEAGASFWLRTNPYQVLADLNPRAVILLDILPEALVLSVEAETKGKLSPLHILKVLRSSLGALDIAYSENAVKALYARAGLIDGSVGLIPWLELGVPAIRLHGQLNGWFKLLPAEIEKHLDAYDVYPSIMRDVNYLRYQLPSAVISLDDVSLTRVILILLAVFMASVALRPLFTRNHTGGLGPGALPEALVAYLFSFIAVSLSWLIHGSASRLFGSNPLSINMTSLALAIGISGRLGSSMLFFFALSGLSSRLGLLPHAVRGTASQAAAMIAGVLGMSVLFFSIQGSLILFGVMILLSLAGVNAAVAVLSISLLVVILFPLIFSAAPVFIPGLVTILNARGHQLLLLAGFTAPVALWILTTLSPRHRLVRGDRTAPYLVAVALVFCFLDPWLRSRL